MDGLGFVVVTHGRFGEELLAVARYIMGHRLGAIGAVRVPFQEQLGEETSGASKTPFADRQEFVREAIAAAADEVERGSGVIVLTDIQGGTAFNCARSLLVKRRMAIVAGVNLPMLLKVPSVRGLALGEAAAELSRRSREAIVTFPVTAR